MNNKGTYAAEALDLVCRTCLNEYCQGASKLEVQALLHPPQSPSGLLNALKLHSNIKGFFKPLTGDLTKIHAAAQNPSMVGCQVTLQGPGVQWVLDKVRVQGCYSDVTFSNPPCVDLGLELGVASLMPKACVVLPCRVEGLR